VNVILGDVAWLTKDFPNYDPKMPVKVMVTNGRQVRELPISGITVENAFVITVTLPKDD
jgi:hypothetical protein